MEDANSSSKAKAPESLGNGGFRSQGGVTVQPPKREDLQPSYASVVGEEASSQKWYPSMCKSPFSCLKRTGMDVGSSAWRNYCRR